MPELGGSSIKLENVTKVFGKKVVAVVDVSLEVQRGKFLTLLGPSGSGKTTILMMIAGFQTPTSGNIFMDDSLIMWLPPFKRNIGMVFQNYALFPHMTVFDNIAFSLRMRKVNKSLISERVNSFLELVELSGFGDRLPGQLSGGQQQRVALARALVFDPKVLLMDEPLGALDKKLRELMQLEIVRIQKKLGITVIYVTHDQSEALTMSDKIAILNFGKIQQLDNPIEIYKSPKNSFVADFIGESNLITGEIKRLEKDVAVIDTERNLRIRIKISNSDSASVNNQVKLVLRPERISIFKSNRHYPNTYEVTVEEVIYLGESTKYKVKTTKGESLMVKQQNITGEEIFSAGDLVKIGCKEEDPTLI